MIRLESIGKQNGQQIVFIEASAALQKGEKIGLVGPNGAGKTTLFRMITGEEQPDEGQVSVDRGVTIGYFSQDVGDMAGRSAVAEVMDGAGPVSALAAELAELEAAMADPDRADEMDEIITRYGEVQGRFEELDGYALDGRAREVLDGLGFSQEMMDGDVGKAVRRLEDARGAGPHPADAARRDAARRAEQPSRSRKPDLAGGVPQGLRRCAADDLARPRVHEPHRQQDRRDRRRRAHRYSGNYEFYQQQRAIAEKQMQAQFERQQAMLAKEIAFIERFKARATHAAQVQSRVKKLDKIDRVEPPKRRQTVVDSSSSRRRAPARTW